ncbi:hypothetical protein [Streptomyces mirabilis]|uniref:hypothetical protein n=1 Tax=Streptomyces mirabilis TaxID=68239 RepID=UPI0037FBA01F
MAPGFHGGSAAAGRFLRVLRIRRQVQLLGWRLYFALPKGGETRVVDMPPSVASGLAQYSWSTTQSRWNCRGAFRSPIGRRGRKPALAAAGVIPLRKKDER